MKNPSIFFALATLTVVLCLRINLSYGNPSPAKVYEDDDNKAIKDYISAEMKHILHRRDADDDSTSTTSTTAPTTTTKKPAVVKKKKAKKTTKKPSSTTSSKPSTSSTSKPSDDEDSATSTTTTGKPKHKKPHELDKETSDEVKKEEDFWKDAEKEALDFAISGIESWIRSYLKLSHTKNELRLGKLMYLISNKLLPIMPPSRSRSYVDVYLKSSKQHSRPSFSDKLYRAHEDDV